ncbi:MAG: Na+/H+ antiporter subunit E [Candidatus Eiseniibacteriota bacterium]|jgi:multicomponent Na+:H+ antiporter subunit E
MPGLLELVLITGLWVLLTGNAGPANLLAGVAMGIALLAWLRLGIGDPRDARHRSRRTVLRKVPAAIGFLGFLVGELVLSSMRIAIDVLTPGPNRHPALVVVPLDVDSDLEIALLANLVSLTPGTLALEVSRDRREMLIHAMFAPDHEALRREIKDGYERRVKELLA